MFLLLATTCISFLGTFLPVLIKPVLSLLNMETEQEAALKAEVLAIRREMSNISIIDEFAKHARHQRRLNQLQDELKTLGRTRQALGIKKKLVITLVLRVLMGLTGAYLFWNYKHIPVIVLPSKWLYPLNSIFQWPTDVDGGVSITSWLVVSGTVAKMAASALNC